MLKTFVVVLIACAGLLIVSETATAGGWYVSGYRSFTNPRASYYRSRTVVNPAGPGYYVSRSRFVGATPYVAPPLIYGGPAYVTGPVYPAAVGYQFTPYYYPVIPVPVAPAPITVYEYGW